MSSDENKGFAFMSLSYEVHSSLFQHYSSLIVKARISIMTLIILAFCYVLGVFHSDIDKQQIFGVMSTRSIISYLASFLIVCLFLMEIHYCRRLLQIISVSKAIERELKVEHYFINYDRATRWPLYILYGLSIFFPRYYLLSKCCYI